MADCNLSVFPIFEGEPVCTGATEQEKMDRYCAWNTFFRDTFTPAVGTLATELGTCINWIEEKSEQVAEDKQTVSSLKTDVEQLKADTEEIKDVASQIMGAEYAGEWNSTNDFTGKLVTFNGSSWIALTPTIGEEPTDPDWAQVGAKKQNIVYVDIDQTVSIGDLVLVDTTEESIYVYLPENPIEGDFVDFVDIRSSFDVNDLTIMRNGNFIMGLDENLMVEKKNISLRLKFLDDNWRIV